jgi:RHS repeat-associated protein
VAIVVQETHYDPWGLELAGLDFNAPGNAEHRFKYNGGVERTVDFGLSWDESGARMYDPQVPRFLGVDPLADKEGQESWTPYHYGFDNPARYNDPDGRNPCDGCPKPIVPGSVLDKSIKTYEGMKEVGQKAVDAFVDKMKAMGKAVGDFFSSGTEVFTMGSGEERKGGVAVVDTNSDSFTKETDKSHNVTEVKKGDLDAAKTALNPGEVGTKNPNLGLKGGEQGPDALGATDGSLTYTAKRPKVDTTTSESGTGYIIKTWHVGDDKYVDTTHIKIGQGTIFYKYPKQGEKN